MISENENIVRIFIEAYNEFDIDSMLELLHSEIEFKNISGGEINAHTRGKVEFENIAKQSVSLFKEREQKIISFKESGNKATVEIEYRAVLTSDISGKLKAGDSILMNGRSEYQFKDGLISSLIDES
ncbi:MAG: nuclear transport factor 2 family protein [Ignavibacteriales bacterium]|nr:MAG: nuclear transport factor 2 family protein [Ignavibacteriales bacterium]